MADEGQNGKQIISRNARLPLHTLDSVRPQVQALADLAAASSKERIAEQLGVEAKGRFNGKLAAARYYRFIESAGGNLLQVTERGRAFLRGDSEDALRAMREAVMGTGYGQVIYLLRTSEPKLSIIAARLQDDLNVPAESAPASAKVLVAISREAGLIGENGRFSASAIEDTHAALEAAGDLPEKHSPAPKPQTPAAKPQTPGPAAARSAPKPASSAKETNGKPAGNGLAGDGGQPLVPLAAAPLQVIVNVDASKLGPEQVAELINALRAPVPPTPTPGTATPS